MLINLLHWREWKWLKNKIIILIKFSPRNYIGYESCSTSFISSRTSRNHTILFVCVLWLKYELHAVEYSAVDESPNFGSTR